MLLNSLPLQDPPRHLRHIATGHPARMCRQTAMPQRPVLFIEPRKARGAAGICRWSEPRSRTQITEPNDGTGARGCIFGVGGVGCSDREKADAGEKGPQRGEAGADDAEGLLHYGPDYSGRNGVLEVVEVDQVEGPDANDGSNTSAVGRTICQLS